jgi:hypothetical protein
MASLKSISAKKKKPEAKKVPQRKSSAAKVLEERHIGEEITNWIGIEDSEKAVAQNLRHYGYFYDHKDAFKWAQVWVKKNRPSDYANFCESPDWRVNTTLGGLCKMLSDGAEFTQARMAWINNGIDQAVEAGKVIREVANNTPTVSVKTTTNTLAEKAGDFIANVEDMIDLYYEKKYEGFDAENYSVFNELKKISAPKPLAQRVYDYYKPLFDEVEELVVKKTEDLVEGYRHLKTVKDKKDYLAFIKNIIDDCSKYLNAATAAAVRKPRQARVKKKIPVEKLVEKVKFQKESSEFKLTSVDPVNIIGSTEVYLFNTKYRFLVQLIAASVEGFSIKGTTITNIREDGSLRKTLRKPEDTLTEVGKATKARVGKLFIDINTKSNIANGRLNEDTIIVKVYR